MIKQLLEGLARLTESAEEIRPDIWMLRFTVVNAFILRNGTSWILVDTGLESSYDFILETASQLDRKPEYILLTHGHFDHVGSVKRLASLWDVPVYAHELEHPYLTGEKDYPPGKTEADEGLVAKMSAHFPDSAIDISGRLLKLPADGAVPGFSDWTWVATPGHTPGHVSLFRPADGVLVAGDAFTSTKQESLLSVLFQREKVKGPPAYFTQDWAAAKASVHKLAAMKPTLALLSHGKPLEGDDLTDNLEYLAEHFDKAAVPR
jgi:glyoxylase-like metal-dependent hydrolase (beta-lactamase superfamily II)